MDDAKAVSDKLMDTAKKLATKRLKWPGVSQRNANKAGE